MKYDWQKYSSEVICPGGSQYPCRHPNSMYLFAENGVETPVTANGMAKAYKNPHNDLD
jgi:hypothetical protein